ncbi:hypothetical protein XELAEV_18007251mg [Xenopus laevis]|uniref:Ig-like domain-containing protein n=1 Tax=Xenopus laevis TaxID=8355 RepID=A0A974E0C2_XENLA|nr:hypothetical protein XELAEV_18007251mg [Xenopus laevis]
MTELTFYHSVLVLFSGVMGQNTVDQPSHQNVIEGHPFQINCSYKGTERTLQWYRQNHDQSPQALLLLSSTRYKSENDFTMFLDITSKFTFLYKNTTQMEDSAVYYCALDAQQFSLIGVEYNILTQGTRSLLNVELLCV